MLLLIYKDKLINHYKIMFLKVPKHVIKIIKTIQNIILANW